MEEDHLSTLRGGEPSLEEYEVFRIYVQAAMRGFSRSPILGRLRNASEEALLLAGRCVRKAWEDKPAGMSPIGWLNALVYAVLIYKKGDAKNPSNYRPITCLNTCYKVLTAAINALLLKHLEGGSAFTREQRANKKGEWGCLHASLIDRAIVQDAQVGKRHPLSVAWLDYKKAFDSIPHAYIKWLLRAVNAPRFILRFVDRAMDRWGTTFHSQNATTRKIPVKNGIFQGDSLSPTLFVLAVGPLSYALNRFGPRMETSFGRTTGRTLQCNHLFYMDDLKLFARGTEQLSKLLRIVRSVSSVLGLELNLDKCAKAEYIPGGGRVAPSLMGIRELGEARTYRYLGIEQHFKNTGDGYNLLVAEAKAKVRQILSTDLSLGQKRLALSSIVVAKMSYFYMMTAGGKTKLVDSLKAATQLDTEIRAILSEEKAIYAKSCTSRVYLAAEEGGHGWPSMKDELENQVVASYAYLASMPELRPIWYFNEATRKSGKRSINTDVREILARYEVEVSGGNLCFYGDRDFLNQPRNLRKYLVNRIREYRAAERILQWRSKEVAGKVHRMENLNHYLSFRWLKRGCISSQNARIALGIQEHNILTRASAAAAAIRRSLGRNQSSLCRQCGKREETVEHVVSSCSKWLSNLYVERHDAALRVVYYHLATRYGLPTVHYSQELPHQAKSDSAELLWNVAIQTQRLMDHRKPDLVLIDSKNKQIYVVEISVASAVGIEQQHNIKFNRYAVNSRKQEDETKTPYERGPNLVDDMRQRYKMDVSFIPIVIGTTGEITYRTTKALEELPGMNRRKLEDVAERLSRAVVINTARIVKNHLAKK